MRALERLARDLSASDRTVELSYNEKQQVRGLVFKTDGIGDVFMICAPRPITRRVMFPWMNPRDAIHTLFVDLINTRHDRSDFDLTQPEEYKHALVAVAAIADLKISGMRKDKNNPPCPPVPA